MSSENFGRRGLLRKGAAIGLAASAAGLAVAGTVAAQDATPAATPSASAHLDQLKSDVQTEYDKAQAELDRLGANIGDDSRDAFDKAKVLFVALGAELDKAEAIPHDSVREVKRAFRDIQHKLEDFDLEIEHILHKAGDASGDALHEARKAAHEVHKKIDHVIDGLSGSRVRSEQ